MLFTLKSRLNSHRIKFVFGQSSNSSSVKITEAVPNYTSGKEVANYNMAFKMETKQANDGKLAITLNEIPVFVEEK